MKTSAQMNTPNSNTKEQYHSRHPWKEHVPFRDVGSYLYCSLVLLFGTLLALPYSVAYLLLSIC